MIIDWALRDISDSRPEIRGADGVGGGVVAAWWRRGGGVVVLGGGERPDRRSAPPGERASGGRHPSSSSPRKSRAPGPPSPHDNRRPVRRRGRGDPDPSPEFINQRKTPLPDGMIAAKPGLKEKRSTTSAIGSSSSPLSWGSRGLPAKSRIYGGAEVVSVPMEGEIP